MKPLQFLKKYRIIDYDVLLIILVCTLTVFGILAIGNADPSLRNKQIAGFALGLFMMFFISFVDYHLVIRLYPLLYAVNLILLIWVVVAGHESHNAQRWINLFGFTFQPSETAKLLLILFYAQFIMKYRTKIKQFKLLTVLALMFIPPLVLVVLQPDLSTSIMIALIFSTILFVAGIHWKVVATVLLVSVPFGLWTIYTSLNGTNPFMQDYQQLRIRAWFFPEQYANSIAYQTINSMMAIGSGQLYGKGYATGEIASVLEAGFISESQTDFIFTVIGEEFGFVGGMIVILLIFAISVKCMLIANRSKDMAGRVIAAGLSAWIGLQGFLNIGVACGVMPNTGIPLPFVSSGLTALISVFMGIGFVLNVRLQSRRY